MKKIFIFIMSLTFMTQNTGNWAMAFAAVERQVIDIAGLPVKGPANASVTIIVFSDYLCPVCNRLEPVLKQVLEQYHNDVKLVHKLCPYHDFSREAVEAAYAAWDQGKFWEYHDLLFYNQLVLNKPQITAIAEELHLDLKRFNKKMKDPAIQKLIDRDMADVSRLGILGTPTVYVNGKVLNDRSLQGFQTAIEGELKK
ncbi:MAG: thioredoxin domain-containing protein [Geobacteraceae bacterium]|jgi:protein-disulfide isomerase